MTEPGGSSPGSIGGEPDASRKDDVATTLGSPAGHWYSEDTPPRGGGGYTWRRPRIAWGLPVILAITLLWRAPSFFDPPWVNDEGTYFAIARSMAHGFRLYTDVWENKPPAIYLVYEAVFQMFGPSLVAVRLLAALAVCGSVTLTYVIGRFYMDERWGRISALLAGLLLGVPFLEGTTGNAEVFLGFFAALGVYLGLLRGRPELAGVSMALATAFKAVAGFDALALGIFWCVRDRGRLWRYACAGAAALALMVALAEAEGILRDMLKDAVLYDFGYVGQGNGGGIPWLLGLKVVVLAAITFVLYARPFPYLWLAFALAGALFSGRVFGHYLVQTFVPLSVVVAMALRKWPKPEAVLIALPLAFLGLGVACAVIGWALAAGGHDSILARRLQYYPNFIRYALHTETRGQYESQVDDHVRRNERVADVVRHQRAGRLLVWGNTPWLYVLSGRLPATAYTSSLRNPEVPGETSTLRSAVARGRPAVVVVISPPLPALGDAGAPLQRMYRVAGRIGNATVYARRS